MSIKQGAKFDSPASVADIKPFIAFHRLDMNEIQDPLPTFSASNPSTCRTRLTAAQKTSTRYALAMHLVKMSATS
jgi:phosphatidylserine decarboxylase